MRVLLLTLLLFAGCADLTGRSATAKRSRDIEGEWSAMNLPYYGGRVTRVDTTALLVDYPDRGQANRANIARRYHDALRSNGWKPKGQAGDLITKKIKRYSYRTPDGRKAMLTIDTQSDDVRVTVRFLTARKT